jgi:peptide/nickel transport system ATP-binding protein
VILRRGVIVEMGATTKVFGNPQHAYTQMLLASVPHLHRKWEDMEADYARADAAIESESVASSLVELEPDHLVRRSEGRAA